MNKPKLPRLSWNKEEQRWRFNSYWTMHCIVYYGEEWQAIELSDFVKELNYRNKND